MNVHRSHLHAHCQRLFEHVSPLCFSSLKQHLSYQGFVSELVDLYYILVHHGAWITALSARLKSTGVIYLCLWSGKACHRREYGRP